MNEVIWLLKSFFKNYFAEPYWLWGLAILSLFALFDLLSNFFSKGLVRVNILSKLFKLNHTKTTELNSIADPHLLPYLIDNQSKLTTMKYLKNVWLTLFALLFIVMAGPRWYFVDYETYQPNSALMVLLDLSASMQAEDVKPNRITRAKQELTDILQEGQGIKMGLIAFSRYPHLVTPITDDLATIEHLLPAIDLNLINKPGNEVMPALQLAAESLQAEPGDNKHILLITDGNFKDSAASFSQQLKAKYNISLHVLAIGTQLGSPYKTKSGNWYKENNELVIAKLDSTKLQNLARLGNGYYWESRYSDEDRNNFITKVRTPITAQIKSDTATIRQWEEGFFWFLLPVVGLLLIILRQQMRAGVCGVLLFLSCLLPTQDSYAFEVKDLEQKLIALFKNNDQQAVELYQQRNFSTAAQLFSIDYNKGVAQYRAGDYAAAENGFQQALQQIDDRDTHYNLANSQLMQKKYQPAIDNYELLLKQNPADQAVEKNLRLAQELLAKAKLEKPSKQPEQNNEQEQNSGQERNSQQQQSDQQDSNCNCNNSSSKGKNQAKDETEEGQAQPNQATTNHPDPAKTKDAESNQTTLKQNGAKIANNGDAENRATSMSADQQDERDNLREFEQQSAIANKQIADGSKQELDEVADRWLNRMDSDIQVFLQNKFLMEERLAVNSSRK